MLLFMFFIVCPSFPVEILPTGLNANKTFTKKHFQRALLLINLHPGRCPGLIAFSLLGCALRKGTYIHLNAIIMLFKYYYNAVRTVFEWRLNIV